jgi:tRNA 2-selenouridine synthase
MQAAPRITLRAPLACRAAYLARAYADVVADRSLFDAALARLPVPPGRKALARWTELANAGDLEALAADLMQNHYDPAYDRAAKKQPTRRLGVVELAGLTVEAQEAGAEAIAAIVQHLAADA